MSNLRNGFGRRAKVSYLEAGGNLPAPAGITGLQVDVLGPPRDEDFLSDMDEKGIHSYLRGPSDDDEVNIHPFGTWWTYTPDGAETDPAFLGLRLTAVEREALRKELTEPVYEELAFSLDNARNNSSLVLLFRFRGKTLLFPGDAQWGNWHYWLDNLDSQPKLEQLDFLKVGHHGSHNASPREAIEKMTSGHLAAMISTQTPKPWDTIPRLPLLDRVKELTGGNYIRSDSLALQGHPASPGAEINELPPGFSKGAFWYDYTITV
jgi:hypothetical protein